MVLGVDIGGSHITTSLVDINRGQLVKNTKSRNSLNSKGSKEYILKIWKSTIESSIPNISCEKVRIGLAIPAPFDYENGISLIRDNDKYDALYGFDVKSFLIDELGFVSDNIRFKNDAQCFLQGELFSVSAKNSHKAIGLTLGTGLGSAIARNGIARDAELWKSPFKDGILEDYLSTRWFLKRYRELTGMEAPNVKEMSLLAAESNLVKSIFSEFADNLALFLISFVRNENPDVIILGGNITRSQGLFLPHVKEKFVRQGGKVPIKISALGENAPIIGAVASF